MSYKAHIRKQLEMRGETPDITKVSGSYVNSVISRTETRFAEIDWPALEIEGFHKKDDYCFIYSYPPVRALKKIEPDDLFRPSRFGSLNGPVDLYIHIPYCTGICSYCYFAKVLDTDKAPVKRSDYAEFLRLELDMILAQADGTQIGRAHV